MAPSNDGRELLVLVFALFGADGEITRRALSSVGIESEVCATVDDLVEGLGRGAGALVLVEEALLEEAVEKLSVPLRAQEPWSDIPIIVSARETGGGREGLGVLRALGALGNVAIVERPVRFRAMIGAVESALRARRRQYETRALLTKLEKLVVSEREARLESESVSRSKDEFLATLSHELRTPLNAVLGFARLLSSGRLEGPSARRALEAIERNAIAQAQLIEDLLDVSRIISGKLRLELAETSLLKVVDAAVETVRPALQAKEIRFDAALDPAASNVMGDPNRLQQIVWNLLSNAIKFTPRGGHVQLSVARVDAQIELTVSDSGQGMDPAFLPLVFQRFYQADGSATRKHGGLGLGLAICRHLVELHGGTIEAASDGPGRGATFTVCLPLMPLRRDPSEPAPARALVMQPPAFSPSNELRGVKVLVVDDEADARELLTSLLGVCGGVTIEASSASEALALVVAEKPDVLVSDIGMPGEDGYSLIRRLRALPPEEGGRTPAAALTAYARSEDRRRVLDAGFDLYLTKPVNPDDFVKSVARLVRERLAG